MRKWGRGKLTRGMKPERGSHTSGLWDVVFHTRGERKLTQYLKSGKVSKHVKKADIESLLIPFTF